MNEEYFDEIMSPLGDMLSFYYQNVWNPHCRDLPPSDSSSHGDDDIWRVMMADHMGAGKMMTVCGCGIGMYDIGSNGVWTKGYETGWAGGPASFFALLTDE